MSQYILAIDQGTTGTTVNIINPSGASVGRINREYEQIYPQPGWVEHNPDQIWSSVIFAIKTALEQAGLGPKDLAAIGITNQRETVVVWERATGKAIHNAIVWQCRRTAADCEKLKKRGLEKLVHKKTGLVLDPYFSATKIAWLLNHVPGAKARAQKGELAAGTIDSYLIWRLTGGRVHRTDVSNASRTLLFNLTSGQWDDELLKTFGVPRALLPEVVPSSGILGTTDGKETLVSGIPIAGVAGDQQAALFGQTAFKVGEAKCTYGTGSFILLNTGNKPVFSRSGILTTVAWQLKGQKQLTYALEGGAFICGAAVQWLRDSLGVIKESREVEDLARQVTDTAGVQFVPALTGLGAPYWDPYARGMVVGLTRGATRAHLARATLEAMALQNVDILRTMEKDLKKKLGALRVDGGAAANDMLMQMQADFMGQKILRPQMIATTSAGAAYLAGLGVGFWSDLGEIQKIWAVDKEFQPQLKASRRTERLDEWQRAIRAVRNYAALERG